MIHRSYIHYAADREIRFGEVVDDIPWFVSAVEAVGVIWQFRVNNPVVIILLRDTTCRRCEGDGLVKLMVVLQNGSESTLPSEPHRDSLTGCKSHSLTEEGRDIGV